VVESYNSSFIFKWVNVRTLATMPFMFTEALAVFPSPCSRIQGQQGCQPITTKYLLVLSSSSFITIPSNYTILVTQNPTVFPLFFRPVYLRKARQQHSFKRNVPVLRVITVWLDTQYHGTKWQKTIILLLLLLLLLFKMLPHTFGSYWYFTSSTSWSEEFVPGCCHP
jgi:hypothetical protein